MKSLFFVNLKLPRNSIICCYSIALRDSAFWLKELHFLASAFILNSNLNNPVLIISYFPGILLFLPISILIFNPLCTSIIDSSDNSMQSCVIICVNLISSYCFQHQILKFVIKFTGRFSLLLTICICICLILKGTKVQKVFLIHKKRTSINIISSCCEVNIFMSFAVLHQFIIELFTCFKYLLALLNYVLSYLLYCCDRQGCKTAFILHLLVLLVL